MTLIPAPHSLIVQPSMVKNTERELPSGLQVVTHDRPAREMYRGVVERIGSDCDRDIERGFLVHYSDFAAIGDRHVVPQQHVLAWEDE